MILRRRHRWLFVASGVLAAGLGVRAWHFARLPPFTVALPSHRGVHYEVDGMSLSIAVAGGEMAIHAGHARPGHERVGYFRLGPSTYVELRDVRAALRMEGRVAWEIRAARGRLAEEVLTVRDARLEEAGASSQHDELRIHLDSGRLQR